LDNDTCTPEGANVLSAFAAIILAACGLAQINDGIEGLVSSRAACYPALQVMRRALQPLTNESCSSSFKDGFIDEDEDEDEEASSFDSDHREANLPPYKIDSSSTEGIRPTHVTGELEFKDVDFSYPARRDQSTFQGFNLKIPANSTVAIVGPVRSYSTSPYFLLAYL
jgi:ABC-type multidrug transport system fused ATPase/permease subunit